MDVREVALLNALAPMLVTDDGMVIEVNANAPRNVFAGIELIKEGRITVFNPFVYENTLSPKSQKME